MIANTITSIAAFFQFSGTVSHGVALTSPPVRPCPGTRATWYGTPMHNTVAVPPPIRIH